MKSPRASLAALLTAQAQESFNDCAAKFMLIGLAQQLARTSGEDPKHWVSLIAFLLVAPFVLFAPVCGWLSDRFPKRTVLNWTLVPTFVVLRKLSQYFTTHAFAELAAGHSDVAFADIRVVHRLADSLGGQSTLVETMIRVAILGLTLQPFEEGLSTGAWSDQELVEFQKYFESVNLLVSFDAALRGGERNSVTRLVEDLPRKQFVAMLAGNDSKDLKDYAFNLVARWCPRGWLFQNAVSYSQMMQKSFEAYDVRAQRVFPDKCEAALTFILEQLQVASIFKYLAARGIPNIAKATQAMAQQQTSLREAALACALERYRRAHGEYPAALAALVPQFIAKLPTDLMTGEGLKYQRPDKDGFSLYSVGWNLKDDAGARTKDRGAGDWVWPPPK